MELRQPRYPRCERCGFYVGEQGRVHVQMNRLRRGVLCLKCAEETVSVPVFFDAPRYSPQWRSLYNEYIGSDRWRFMRALRLELAGNKCEHCGRGGFRNSLHCHHKTYARIGHERMDDLMILCVGCHSAMDIARVAMEKLFPDLAACGYGGREMTSSYVSINC
jgi:hypothetical protein